MNIGQAAKASGVSPKMVRYYESIGLLPPAGRRDSGYRDYGPDDVHRLGFVRRARDLGFSLERIKSLLDLWSDQHRSNQEVRAIALAHLKELEAQRAKLESMIAAVRQLTASCEQTGSRAHCPIIEELGDHHPAPARPAGRRTGPARPAA